LKSIDQLLKERSGIKLDFCCGANKHGPDWVGFDVLDLPGVDIIHDALDIPYPLPDECVGVAIASHVLEHIPKTQVVYMDGKFKTINPFLMVMNELWRIMKPDAKFAIAVPHGASPGFMQDPTHASQLNRTTWAYFDPLMYGGQLYNFYRPKPWKVAANALGEPLLAENPAGNMEVVMQKRRMDVSYA
jgi:hypothetical protein